MAIVEIAVRHEAGGPQPEQGDRWDTQRIRIRPEQGDPGLSFRKIDGSIIAIHEDDMGPENWIPRMTWAQQIRGVC